MISYFIYIIFEYIYFYFRYYDNYFKIINYKLIFSI